ncbi:hypothetical protein B0J18DRAFT_435168 [Chaetomium sp. MPI-SDFR-AT-0129]|nr:hypothetical protein B0J18DRAFT_435168 [Chaetomium sp. MPI-SDFR-AT-0129]
MLPCLPALGCWTCSDSVENLQQPTIQPEISLQDLNSEDSSFDSVNHSKSPIPHFYQKTWDYIRGNVNALMDIPVVRAGTLKTTERSTTQRCPRPDQTNFPKHCMECCTQQGDWVRKVRGAVSRTAADGLGDEEAVWLRQYGYAPDQPTPRTEVAVEVPRRFPKLVDTRRPTPTPFNPNSMTSLTLGARSGSIFPLRPSPKAGHDTSTYPSKHYTSQHNLRLMYKLQFHPLLAPYIPDPSSQTFTAAHSASLLVKILFECPSELRYELPRHSPRQAEWVNTIDWTGVEQEFRSRNGGRGCRGMPGAASFKQRRVEAWVRSGDPLFKFGEFEGGWKERLCCGVTS